MLHLKQSMEPLTEFAPKWAFPFWTACYPNLEHLDVMNKWITDNEQTIINKYSGMPVRGDGGTGLGPKSLTAQYPNFNLFRETVDVPEFQELHKFIRLEYSKFMKELGTQERDCKMYAWANVMRTGEKINSHNHGGWHFSYLSGNMHFDNYPTVTRYCNPFDSLYFDFPNIKGGLVFFPSYIYHSASEFTSEGKRVSMAFDLFDRNHLEHVDLNYVDFNI